MNGLRFGSVCSGIEAASVAFNPLGWEAAWFSEIEPFPCKVLAHHYPDVVNLGDMKTLPARIASGDVEAPDVLCGGPPCQSFSTAGGRASLGDARGNLTLTFCEILNATDIQRDASGRPPAVALYENVPGLLSTKDNAFGHLLAGLAGESEPLYPSGGKWTNAGYVLGPQRAVAWRVLDAQHFGVPQRRRRVYVIASARYGFDPLPVLFEFGGVRRDSAPSRGAGQDVAGTLATGAGGGGFPGTDEALSGYVQPVALAFGGNRCADAPLDVATPLSAHGAPRFDFASDTFIVFDTTQITSPHNYSSPRRGGPSHPLAAGAHPPALAGSLGVRRLLPVECEKLMGFPPGYADLGADTPRYKALGNSWAVPVVRWIGERIDRQLQERAS